MTWSLLIPWIRGYRESYQIAVVHDQLHSFRRLDCQNWFFWTTQIPGIWGMKGQCLWKWHTDSSESRRSRQPLNHCGMIFIKSSFVVWIVRLILPLGIWGKVARKGISALLMNPAIVQTRYVTVNGCCDSDFTKMIWPRVRFSVIVESRPEIASDFGSTNTIIAARHECLKWAIYHFVLLLDEQWPDEVSVISQFLLLILTELTERLNWLSFDILD